MDRLKKLESAVLSLGAHVATDDEEAAPKESGSEDPKESEKEIDKDVKDEDHHEKIMRKVRELRELKRQVKELHGTKQPQVNGLEGRFGRLVVGDGKSRYINPSFWASLSNEVGECNCSKKTR
jgi:hypothetical protein